MTSIPPEPPDPPDVPIDDSLLSPPVFSSNSSSSSQISRKRGSDNPASSHNPKITVTDTSLPSASVQTVFTHPSLSEQRVYSPNDQGPFIVHVFRPETIPSSGSTFNVMKFGQFLVSNNIKNISKGGVKKIGRNRVAVEFNNAESANSFANNALLKTNQYGTLIPSYNISRMGIVRDVPVDWSMDEFVKAIELPDNCEAILKARRLNRKSINADGSVIWVPTKTVVITFSGQVLPSKIYCYHTALPVETYQLPTIQCLNCCRFDHIKTQCRSKPRCYRCAQSHSGESCSVSVEQSSCLLCSGRHLAIDKACPEHSRQKAIKIVMSDENISYYEASARFPAVRRPYSDITKSSAPSQYPSSSFYPSQSTSGSYISPSSNNISSSHRKTVFITPKPKPSLSNGYDKATHQSLTADRDISSPSVGCALNNPYSVQPDENLTILLVSTLINILSKFNDCQLPDNVAQKLTQLFSFINNGPDSSMEL